MKKEDMKFLESLLKEREEPKNIEYTNVIKNKYGEELEDFNYIHNLEDFKNLKNGGIIKSVRLDTGELRKGGILIKIEKLNNKWYALIGSINKKIFWRIYFNSNYIYYRKPYSTYKVDDKTERFINAMNKFITPEELPKFQEQIKPNKVVDELYKSYVKNDLKNNN